MRSSKITEASSPSLSKSDVGGPTVQEPVRVSGLGKKDLKQSQSS